MSETSEFKRLAAVAQVVQGQKLSLGDYGRILTMCSALIGGGMFVLGHMFYDKTDGIKLEAKVQSAVEKQGTLEAAVKEQTGVMQEMRDTLIEIKTELRVDRDKGNPR